MPPNGVVILELLNQSGTSILETFPKTGYNILNARKVQFCKQPFEIIQGEIAFKNTIQNCCILCCASLAYEHGSVCFILQRGIKIDLLYQV